MTLEFLWKNIMYVKTFLYSRFKLCKTNDMKHFYSVIIGKQKLLYKDFQIFKKKAADDIEKANAVAKSEADLRIEAEANVKDIESMMKSFIRAVEDQDLRQSITDTQRSLTILKVNELKLKRQFMAVSETESILRKENSKLKVVIHS
jgi:hypothetical protein